MLKAVANTIIGQEHGSVGAAHEEAPQPIHCIPFSSSLSLSHFLSHQPENIKLAQQYFQLVGSSGSECGECSVCSTDAMAAVLHCLCSPWQTQSLAGKPWPPASSSSGSLRTCWSTSAPSRYSQLVLLLLLVVVWADCLSLLPSELLLQ